MRNIWRIFTRDLGKLRRNVIALIVAVGLVIVPPLYAWFNIGGGWDPYGNTGGMKVAIANEDEGYKSDLIPIEVNIGETVVSTLRANNQLNLQFVDGDQALEGVKSGEYYAALVIPKSFSADMMTLFSTDVKHSKIIYYENQKMSAVSPEVTSQGATTIQTTVNSTFAQTISDVGLSAASGIMDYLDSDQVANYVANLSSTLDSGIGDLRSAASALQSFEDTLGSTVSLVNSTSDLMGGTGGTSEKAGQALSDAKSGMSDIQGAISGSTSLINRALKDSASSYSSVSTAIDQAADAGSEQLDDAEDDLKGIAGDLMNQAVSYRDIRDVVARLPQSAVRDRALDALDTAIQRNNELAEKLTGIASSLEDGSKVASQDVQAAKDAVAAAKASVDTAKDSYEETLKSQVDDLSDSIEGITSSTSSISDELNATVSTLSDASGSLADDLGDFQRMLGKAKDTLNKSADSLQKLKDDLASAVQSGDLDRVRDLIGSDPAALATELAAPVGLDTRPIFPMKNNGSAMAPFYTILSIWVGSIVLAAMLSVEVPDRVVERFAPIRLHEVYLGRFCIFGLLSLCQTTLVVAGDIMFFGIQCLNPPQMFLACWVSGIVFTLIVYTLTVSFGTIGKAVAVVLLVMQVAASGGEFPIAMYEPVFQAIYPFLPFVHGMDAVRAAMAGAYGNEYWVEIGCLLAYLIPVLALGIVFRRPVIRLNRWIIEKLEDTKFIV